MADDPNNTKAAFDKNWVSATEVGTHVTQSNGGAWVLALVDTRDALLGGCRAALELDQGSQKSYAFPTPEFWFPRDRLRWVNGLNPSMRREDFFDRPWPWELRAYLLPSKLRELFHSEALPLAREPGSTLPVFLHRADAVQWGLLPPPQAPRRSTLSKKRRGTRGPPPDTRDRIARELRAGIQTGRYVIRDGELFEESRSVPKKNPRPISKKNLMAAYKCGKSTLLDALSIVLAGVETPTNSDQKIAPTILRLLHTSVHVSAVKNSDGNSDGNSDETPTNSDEKQLRRFCSSLILPHTQAPLRAPRCAEGPMSKPTKTSEQELPALTPLELNRIVRLAEAGRLCGLSEDSLRRNHSDKIVRLGPRAIGMRVGHVLQLNKARTSARR